ncbi:Cof-type HAD-IIB family hydrolase [Streptococcus oricebi]|uniref:Cof-type HAD-IIB family hydrolase n=1 Tax=Streptococcus oricebi TaxID=1547447 RepID=A0ABS5B0K9_9STRE|nr:Cof-type HAD-IIB family hydrolase [Streptococcus oricebi]MBP2622358.1 Cof-type HAD-IIB family hydrolase [Streptococcus oricebi]
MIKLLALDMDGTLLDSHKKIPQAHIEAIHQAIAQGVKLVLCTGRPLVGVKPYYKELGLSKQNEYVIVDNGCAIHQSEGWKLLDYTALSKEDLVYLDQIAQKTPAQLTIFDEERYLVLGEDPNDLVSYDAGLVFTQPVKISLEEAIEGSEIMFQAMFLAQPDQLDRFEADFHQDLSQRFSAVRSQDYIYETMPKGTTKASALARLAEKLAIKPEEIMAIGDANNDLEMLEFAGLGIAMGNASDYVKSQADAVTTSNDQAGVARAIEKYILKQDA